MITFDYIKTTNKLSITCEDAAIYSSLREYFSIANTDAKFIQKRFKLSSVKISTRKYVITPLGMCDLGLYWEIRQYLIQNQILDTVNISENLKNRLNLSRSYKLYTDLNLSLRNYQVDVVKKAVDNGWGTCILGTGAGKTLITAAIIENYYRNCNNKETFKCLMIVPDLALVSQTYNEFKLYGISYSMTYWTGSNVPDTNCNIVICNMSILLSQFANNDWVKYVDLLIVDEVHRIKPDNKISKVINKIKTPNRFGFTGTLPPCKFNSWYITGKFGPVLYEKSSYELRQEKYLTNVEVKMLQLDHGSQKIPTLTQNKYRNELEFLADSIRRNEVISKLCVGIDNNILILVNHIKHGENIYNLLQTTCKEKQIYFIRGSVCVDEREKIKQIMENSKNIVCVAISAIFSTGVNIKNIHTIIFAAGGKSFIRTVQSIGRGLRLHESKDKLLILDLYDMFFYSQQHGNMRKEIYKQEQINYSVKPIKIA